MSPAGAEWALRRILAPNELTDFMTRLWDRAPAHVSRGDVGYFADLRDACSIDVLLRRPDLEHPDVRLMGNGRLLDRRDYSVEGERYATVDARSVRRIHESGASIIVDAMQDRAESIYLLCNAMERQFGNSAHATLFVAPARAGGATRHFDTTDTYILQLSGTKHWRVWADGKRPQRSVVSSPDIVERLVQSSGEATDYLLQSGDTLYVPRGVVHETWTTHDSSVHLSIGVAVTTWSELLEAVVRQVVDELDIPELRRSARAPVGSDATDSGAAKWRMRERILGELTTDRVLSMMEMLAHDRIRPKRRRFLQVVNQLAHLGPTSLVLCDECIPIRPSVDASGLHLRFLGKVVTFPPSVILPVVWVLKQRHPFHVGDIEGLDLVSQVALARRLLQESVLTIPPAVKQ